MLPAGAGRTEHIHFDVLRTDIHLHGVVDLRDDLQRGEGGVPTAGGIEGGDAHQPVHAGFSLEIAVYVGTQDFDGGAFQARLVAVQIIENLILEAVALRPVGIHAVEHLGPVLGFGTARPRVKGEYRVFRVVFPGQQGGQPLLVDFSGDAFHAFGAFVHQRGILLLVGQLDEGHGVVVIGHQTVIGFDFCFENGGFLHHLLGGVHIVPKTVRRGPGVQFFGFGEHLLDAHGMGQILDVGEKTLQPQP